MIKPLMHDTRGAVFTEYATVIGAVGLVAIVAVAWLAHHTDGLLRTKVGQAVGVGDQTVESAPPPRLAD